MVGDAADRLRHRRIGMAEGDRDPFAALDQGPGDAAFDGAGLAQREIADLAAVDQHRQTLRRQLLLPHKRAELDQHQVGAGDIRAREFERALAALRPAMARLGRIPAGPAKGLAVAPGGEIDHQLRIVSHCDGNSSASRASGGLRPDDAHEILDIM